MKKYTFIFVLLAGAFIANAQYTKNNFKLLASADGEELASFSDSIKVALGPQEAGWYKATFKVIVAKTAITADSILLSDIDLLNSEKELIGKSSGEMKVNFRQAEGRGFYKYYEAIITGYIKSYSIEYSSIPERAIEKMFGEKNMNTRNEMLHAYFEKMDFQQSERDGFTIYVYLDEAASFGDPHYRTIVIYRGETLVYCIVSRNEIMQLEKVKDELDDSTGKYYFFQRAQEKTTTQMKNIVYDYIPL